MKRLVLIICGFLLAAGLKAQGPWTVDLRPSLSFPVSEFQDTSLRPGFGSDLIIMHRIMPHLKAVGGWGFQSFDSKVDESSDQIELRENSFLFGFELRLPYGGERLSYLIYAGGIAGQLSIENKVLALDTRSDYQLGWELGLGAQYQLDENWALKPQLRYRELTGSFALGANTFEEALRYLSLSISVSYAL